MACKLYAAVAEQVMKICRALPKVSKVTTGVVEGVMILSAKKVVRETHIHIHTSTYTRAHTHTHTPHAHRHIHRGRQQWSTSKIDQRFALHLANWNGTIKDRIWEKVGGNF